MIRTLSPYWVETPFVSPATSITAPSYTLQLFIWNGLKNNPPANPQYEVSKINYENTTGFGRIDISKMVNDCIDFTLPNFNFNLTSGVLFYNSPNNFWVKWQIIYNTGDVGDNTPQLATTKLATKGWSYGNEGENAEAIKVIDVSDIKVLNGGFLVIPVYKDELSPTNFTITSYPSVTQLQAFSLSATTDSSEIITYALVKIDVPEDYYLEIKRNNTLIATVFPTTECYYTPYTILFQNRYGAVEQLVMFKERKDNIDVTRNLYENNAQQPSNGFHQYKTLNVQGKRKITLNTGFVFESNNDKIQQLLLSERVWLFEPLNPFTKTLQTKVPVIPITNSLEVKTKVNDGLLNDSLDFEYAFNLINNI